MYEFKFIPDQPVFESEDAQNALLGLDFKFYAEMLAKHVATTPGPFTFGIHGSWGRGKTSLLRAIERELRPRAAGSGKLIPIRFNAWQFEHEDDVLIPLLLTIAAELNDYNPQNATIKPLVTKLTKTMLGLAASMMAGAQMSVQIPLPGLASTVAIDPGKILSYYKDNKDGFNQQKIPKQINAQLSNKSLYYSYFSMMKDVCQELAKSEAKIVLFIDDLDRCSPDRTLNILEHIKLVLAQPGFIFFLALDSVELERYVASERRKLIDHLDDSDSSKDRDKQRKEDEAQAHLYFEKLMQVGFTIPPPELNGNDGYDVFIRGVLGRMGDKSGEAMLDLTDVFGEPLDRNPRRTIKVLNSITLIWPLLEHDPKLQAELRKDNGNVTVLELLVVEIIFFLCYSSFYAKWLSVSDDAKWALLDKLKSGKPITDAEQKADDSKEEPQDRELRELIAELMIWKPLKRTLAQPKDGMFKTIVRRWMEADSEARSDVTLAQIRHHVSAQLSLESEVVNGLQEELRMGYAASIRGEHSEAVKHWSKAIELDPTNPTVYNARGISYSSQRNYPEAIADYTKAIELDPKDPSVYYNRGISHAAQREYPEAIADYTKAIELDPKKANTYNNRGNCFVNSGEYPEAIADYTKAIELDPKKANTYNNRGITYFDQRNYQKAIADYNKALELDPENVDAYCNRGISYSSQRNYQKAIADYNKALELDPENVVAYNNRGNCYRNLGNYPQAIADYTKVIVLDPEDADAYNNRAIAYADRGNYQKAMVDHNKAIELDPKKATAYISRGNSYAEHGKYQKAITDHNMALELDPKNVDAYNSRGTVYIYQGNYPQAIDDFYKAIKLDPKDMAAYYNRELLRYRRNKYEQDLVVTSLDVLTDKYKSKLFSTLDGLLFRAVEVKLTEQLVEDISELRPIIKKLFDFELGKLERKLKEVAHEIIAHPDMMKEILESEE